MKLSTVILTAPLLANEALAFVPSNSPRYESTPTMALQAEKKHNVVGVGAAACLAGLGLSAQAAFAVGDATFQQQRPTDHYSAAAISSSTIVAEIDQFSLPSYDASKGSKLIDLNGEVENVNKQTMAKAKARREYVDNSAEKLEADALRRAEKEGGSLLNSMIGQSDLDKKAMIEAEKAESRANRWKTF